MKNKEQIMKLPAQFRTVQIRQEDIDQEKRTVNLTFSSEEPVERFFGIEILDHSKESVDLSRLQAGGPLLLMHDRAKQIGVVESVEIGDDRRGHAVVRFSRSQLGEEIFQDVIDQIRTGVSVGYIINEVELEKTQKDGPDTYRVTRWTPFEVSIEPTPADITVGVGRNHSTEEHEVKIRNQAMDKDKRNDNTPNPVDIEKEKEKIRMEESKRVSEIMAIGEQFEMNEEARKAIKDGTSVNDFRKLALEKLKNQRHIDSKQANIGLEGQELRQYSVLRGIQALLTGDWSKAGLEMEASREIAKKMGEDPRGFYVPYEVLKRDITTGSGGTGLVATEHLAGNFIDMLRKKAQLINLGAQTLTGLVGNVSIPKQTGAATAYWVAEDADITNSGSTYGSVSLSLKTVGAATPYSRAMLLQSNPSIEQLVMNDLARVLALAIDLAGINGSGAAGQPTGILNTSGIGSEDLIAGNIGWSHIVDLETDVRAADADIDSMAYLTNATVAGILKTREKVSGYPQFLLENGELNGYPAVISNQVPAATIIFGVFSQLLIGMWGGLDIMVDTAAKAASGGVVLRAFQSVDIAVRHAAAFSEKHNFA